jgi:hypothetical protein
MQRRATLVLFLIAAAMAGYYLVVESPRHRGHEPEPLLALDPEAVDSLTIERGDSTLAFHRVATHWEMTRPLSDIAEASAVMRLFAAIADATVERSIGVQDDLAPFGLDAPVTIVATGAGPGWTLQIGDYTVDKGYVYATRGDNNVLLVPTVIRRYATAPVDEFRFQRVATFDISVVDSFRVDGLSGSMAWHRGPTGWFTVVQSDTIRGDVPSVEWILRRMRGLRVIAFPSPERNYFRDGGHPRIVVYRRAPSPPQRFSVALQPARAIVRIDPGNRLVAVDSSIAEVFALGVGDLRDRHLLHFDAAAATRIELETDSTLLTLVRTGGTWQLPNPALGELDADRARAAVGSAGALEFTRVRAERGPEPGSLAGATFRLAVIGDGGTIMDEMTARFEPGDSIAVATSRSSRLLALVPAGNLRRLEERFQRLQSP